MKKNLFLILSILLMFSLVLPPGVIAEKGVEEYIPKIKNIFDIGDDYGEFDVSTQTYMDKKTNYITWMKDSDYISVEIDLEGNIQNFGRQTGNDFEEHAKFPKISKERALKNAEAMISKVDPSLLKNSQYKDMDRVGNLNNYFFYFVRNENGVPFDYNSISVEVDNNTGQISNLNINWDKDIKLPGKENIIDTQEAYKAYKLDQDVELIYKLENKEDKLVGDFLYTVEAPNKAIDAKTGKEVENLNSLNNYIYYGFYGNYKSVSYEDTKSLVDKKEVVTKSEAEKELRSFAGLDDRYTIESSNLKKSALDGRYIWEIQIFRQEGNEGYGTSVQVDAKSKEVLNFNDFNMSEGKESIYNEEQSLEKAILFLKEKMPDKYKQVEYAGSIMYEFQANMEQYSFIFTRLVDGVKIPQNGFSISINAVTGEILDYNYMWNDISLPSRENLISQDKARELLLGDAKLELSYIMDKESIKNKTKQVKLVYNLDDKSSVFIDAKTGKLMKLEDYYNFEDMDERGIDYKDIDKSYAKNMIRKLKENGIYLPGENFKPKEPISQRDFLFLLSNTKGYISSYEDEDLYERFLMEGVVKADENNPDKTITRGEAAKYVVRSFGQEKSAKLGDIYKSNYKDIDSIDKDLKGYVVVAEGLGLVSGKGNFRADDKLTREEAAVITYNILNR